MVYIEEEKQQKKAPMILSPDDFLDNLSLYAVAGSFKDHECRGISSENGSAVSPVCSTAYAAKDLKEEKRPLT